MHCEFAGGVSCRSEDQMQGKRSPRRSGTGFLAREAPARHKIMCVIGSLSEIDWKINSDMAVRQIASESISRSIQGTESIGRSIREHSVRSTESF